MKTKTSPPSLFHIDIPRYDFGAKITHKATFQKGKGAERVGNIAFISFNIRLHLA